MAMNGALRQAKGLSDARNAEDSHHWSGRPSCWSDDELKCEPI